ncbi:unnamed protein product [Rhodiola kirilowii]
MADSDNDSGGVGGHSGLSQSQREQDRFLPIANVSRIMKKALPANAKISKDAKETVQECVSEFISFVTGEASDKCQREKRKTINGDDLLWAMTTLGFEEYVEPLKVYLQRFREMEGDKTMPSQSQTTGANPKESGSGYGEGMYGGGTGSSSMMMMMMNQQHQQQGHQHQHVYGRGGGLGKGGEGQPGPR